ncbi:MAG: hypothetical protein AAGA48_13630 [Myxococcota bacterium]
MRQFLGVAMGSAWIFAGCAPADEPLQEASWLQSAYFDWDLFNHRVSALRFGFAGEDVELAVVGGTSTTNTPADLDDTCDPSTCQEFPFEDVSFAQIGWGRVVSDEVVMGLGTVTLEVPQGGATGQFDIALPRIPEGEVVALLAGFTVNTDHPLSGDEPACYRPEYGWHPRRFTLAIDAITIDEPSDKGIVEVTARFDAGPTLEPERACIDDVVSRSVVTVEVDVLLLAGVDDVSTEVVNSSATYPIGPGGRREPAAQPEVAPSPLETNAPLVGWSSLDFAFDSGEDRGSYLRSFGFVLGPDGAAGVATNFSPFTQLTDFAYAFEGTLEALQLDGDIETGTVTVERLLPSLDGSDQPVVQRFSR